MTKLTAMLLLALLASCLVLVKTSYEARRVFAALDKARGEQRQLDAEFKRLDAERQAQATNLCVDRVARDKLGMRTATPGITQTVYDASVASAASAVAMPGVAR